MSNKEYTAALKRLDSFFNSEAAAEDKILARDLRRAGDFLKSGYNKLANPDNVQNIQIMSQYKKMVEIAMRKSDERISESNKNNMKIVNNILNNANKIR